MGWFFSVLGFIGNLFGWLKQRDLVKQGKAQAEKEVLENNVAEIQRREEAVNAQPKTSYDGRPDLMRDWLRRKNARKE